MAVVMPPFELGLQSFEHCWNRQRWEQLDHSQGLRYEVIDGVLYVATSPSLFHEWISRQGNDLLRAQIEAPGLGWVWTSRVGVFMPGCDPVQPDLVVVLNEQRHIMHDRHINGVPALIVEILSPSHPELDTRIKRAAYARAGVPEYWMIRPGTRDVMACWQPLSEESEFGQSRLFREDEELASATLPVRFAVSQLFAGAPDTTL